MLVYGTINDNVYGTVVIPITPDTDEPFPISVCDTIIPAFTVIPYK